MTVTDPRYTHTTTKATCLPGWVTDNLVGLRILLQYLLLLSGLCYSAILWNMWRSASFSHHQTYVCVSYCSMYAVLWWLGLHVIIKKTKMIHTPKSSYYYCFFNLAPWKRLTRYCNDPLSLCLPVCFGSPAGGAKLTTSRASCIGNGARLSSLTVLV